MTALLQYSQKKARGESAASADSDDELSAANAKKKGGNKKMSKTEKKIQQLKQENAAKSQLFEEPKQLHLVMALQNMPARGNDKPTMM